MEDELILNDSDSPMISVTFGPVSNQKAKQEKPKPTPKPAPKPAAKAVATTLSPCRRLSVRIALHLRLQLRLQLTHMLRVHVLTLTHALDWVPTALPHLMP